MFYRVLWDLRRIEQKLESLCTDHAMGRDEFESIRAFRLYLEQLDPELYAEIHGLITEITEAVQLGLSGDPDDYDKALMLLEATAVVNEFGQFEGDEAASGNEG
jgi:hypothetical protein